MGSSESVEIGEPVVAVGAPLGLPGSVTAGIVSGLDRTVQLSAENGGTITLLAALQTDAAINPGNSGGTLADCAGTLVGVPTANASVSGESGGGGGSIGIGFAIPVDLAPRSRTSSSHRARSPTRIWAWPWLLSRRQTRGRTTRVRGCG